MPIELKMPALSPTMEKGTLAKWLVGVGDLVKAGDLVAEIETDKATMEFETVDEGRISAILVAEGTDEVPVGTVIATLVEAEQKLPSTQREHEVALAVEDAHAAPLGSSTQPSAPWSPVRAPMPLGAPRARLADKVKVSPLAARIADARGIDLGRLTGSGPDGRIVKADLGLETGIAATPHPAREPAAEPARIPDIPHEATKLSNMRRTIARRLTESKQTVPHIYLTVDVQLDALLRLRFELNKGLASRGVKLSVNDMLIKALAVALIEVPSCNVMLAGDQLVSFSRADISVAVSIPAGLITPIVTSADTKSLSAIANEMRDLAARAKDGRLKPEEYQGGTASLSNLGMFAIKQFEAVINPPQGMILAIGAGEKRPYAVNDELAVATVMSVTGSFDHRAIDGADGADFMRAFKGLVEEPVRLLA